MKPTGFIVIWDDSMGVSCPMGWDADCDGAICCYSGSVAFFECRKDARQAINVSEKFANLLIAQGKPANLDFIGDAKHNIKVVPIVRMPRKDGA